MKTLFTIFLLIIVNEGIGNTVFLGNQVFAEGEEEEILKFKYNFPEPRATSAEQYTNLDIPGLQRYRLVGEPVLPVKMIKILLPFGRTYSGIIVSTSSMQEIKGNYLIEPGQSSLISQTERIPPDSKIYSSSEPYPSEVYRVVTLQNKRGYRILYVNLFPVRYIPAKNQLSWCGEMEVEIITIPAPVAAGYRGLSKDKNLIRSQVDNPEIVESYALKMR